MRYSSTNTKRSKHRIKDLPLQDRPREKLLAKGRENLTDVELFAILLGTGTKKQNAVAVSETLLKRFSLQKFPTLPITELVQTSGVGKAKAARIMAALELGERTFAPSLFTKITIQSKEDVLAQLREIVNKKQEQLLVLYLNARHELLQKEILAVGNLNTTLIEPKEIFTPAVLTPCAAIILAHNHPSGDPTPSDEDVHFTKRVQEASEIMGVKLLDHIIVSTLGYFSFAENRYKHYKTNRKRSS